MPGEGYLRRRQIFGNNAANKSVGTADAGPFTLVTAKTNYTVFVQSIKVQLTTGSGAVTWTFQDSAGSPLVISGALSAANAPVSYELDFGADGIPLGAGKNLSLALSGAGAAGQVTVEAYQKLSVVIGQGDAG